MKCDDILHLIETFDLRIFSRMVEYSDISWYISFERSYNEDRKKVEELYGTRNDFDSKSMFHARRA